MLCSLQIFISNLQLPEDTKAPTPDRPIKKRKNSIGKDDKTPTNKKQKTQKVPTRLRTNDDGSDKNKNSPKPENKSNKNKVKNND